MIPSLANLRLHLIGISYYLISKCQVLFCYGINYCGTLTLHIELDLSSIKELANNFW